MPPRAALLLGALLVACGPADPTPDAAPPPDAAPDVSVDAMADLSVDAMPDMAVDAMPDLALDAMPAMPDLAVDAMPHAAPDAMPDAAAPDPVELAYCDCMLLTCHDLYHLLWGEDEGVARRRCFEVAAALPRAPAATEGPNLHCRLHWCDEAFELDDLALCDRAGGLSICR